MTAQTQSVKPPIAMLKNVISAYVLLEKLRFRPDGVVGMGLFYGRSGYGKTMSTVYLQNKTGALLIEADDTWNKLTLLRNILIEAGHKKHEVRKLTGGDLMVAVIEELRADQTRPLIIDEADSVVDRNMITLVRQIHDKALVPVLMIGEPRLADKIALKSTAAFERLQETQLAQPCDVEDTRALASHYCDGIEIADDLVAHIARDGVARRITVACYGISTLCANAGISAIDLAGYRQLSSSPQV